MFFIETLEDETIGDWHRAVDTLIRGVLPVPSGWRYPYTHERVITFSGRRYRSFDTPFGAVIIALMLGGRRRPLPRSLLFLTMSKTGTPATATVVADGTETQVDPQEALEQLAGSD